MEPTIEQLPLVKTSNPVVATDQLSLADSALRVDRAPFVRWHLHVVTHLHYTLFIQFLLR